MNDKLLVNCGVPTGARGLVVNNSKVYLGPVNNIGPIGKLLVSILTWITPTPPLQGILSNTEIFTSQGKNATS